MKLIPVIDLMQGQVVRGVRGDRAAYRPIASALCASSDPLTVAKILCEHCAADQLYVADLDALMGGQAQTAVLRALLHAAPTLALWLDAGFTGADAADALLAELGADASRVVPVFGSEHTAVLSLDRRDGQRLDAAGCWDAPALWPQRVIVMTLERVGSNAGPDLDTLREVRAKSPAGFIVGAGGIRDEDDLARAHDAGAGAWLVASALHDGRLGRAAREARAGLPSQA